MFNNLVTFGCSLTYGHGLKDCFESEGNGAGPEPSKFAWPQLLADTLKLNCINLSSPGSGNTEILHKILDYKFSSEDLVVVFWSYSGRDIVFTDQGDMTRISHFDPYPYVKEWTKVHSAYDLEIKTWLCMHHAHCYFKSMDVKSNFVKLNKALTIPVWSNDVAVLDINPMQLMKEAFDRKDYALDNSHPGESFHKELATILQRLTIINNDSTIDLL
jgi:hypothetical protein